MDYYPLKKRFARRLNFFDFPTCLMERGCFLFSGPLIPYVAQPNAAVWIFLCQLLSSCFVTTSVYSETRKQNGYCELIS